MGHRNPPIQGQDELLRAVRLICQRAVRQTVQLEKAGRKELAPKVQDHGGQFKGSPSTYERSGNMQFPPRWHENIKSPKNVGSCVVGICVRFFFCSSSFPSQKRLQCSTSCFRYRSGPTPHLLKYQCTDFMRIPKLSLGKVVFSLHDLMPAGVPGATGRNCRHL